MPSFAPVLARLASFARLIRFDKRGTGMSDRVSGVPTLETRMDDTRAVMDAVGSGRAALFGSSEGAAMSVLFAATYPERTAALVLRSAYPRAMWAPDYPWGQSEEEYRRQVEDDLRLFGPREQAAEAIRSRVRLDNDQEALQWVDYFRSSASPAAVEALARMNKDIDVRHVLPAIRVPTLIVRGSDDTVVPLAAARYMADKIPGARLVEVQDAGHLTTGQPAQAIATVIERFLTEVWEAGAGKPQNPTACWPQCSSRTSPAPARRLRLSRLTGPGANCCSATTRSCAVTSSASVARRWIPLATASSPPSTGLRVPSAAGARLSQQCRSSAWRCGRACTQANANSWTPKWLASPSTPAPASHRRHNQGRCSSAAPSKTWSQAPASPSRSEAPTSSKASQAWTVSAE